LFFSPPEKDLVENMEMNPQALIENMKKHPAQDAPDHHLHFPKEEVAFWVQFYIFYFLITGGVTQTKIWNFFNMNMPL